MDVTLLQSVGKVILSIYETDTHNRGEVKRKHFESIFALKISILKECLICAATHPT